MRSTLAALLLCAAPALAADPPAGTWKFTLRTERTPVLLLVSFSQADGKWVGDLLDMTAKLPQEPKFADVKVDGDKLQFNLTLAGTTLLSFDGLAAKDGKKIAGTISSGPGTLDIAELKPSKLKKLADPFEMAKETFDQTEDAETALASAAQVLGQAAAKKLPPDEVRGTLDRVGKLAAPFGPRWERHTCLRLAGVLADQDGFADSALAQARKAERLLTDADDAQVRLEVFETLVKVLPKANKPDDLKAAAAQLAKLEARDFAEYAKTSPPFEPAAFAGRKAKSDRVVLLELFSGTEFGPSAAFDLARDAALKAYKPTEVLVLDYHVPLNGGVDPLSGPDTVERFGQYAEFAKRGALMIVAGKPGPRAAQEMTGADSKPVFAAAKELIDSGLEKPAGVKLSVTAAADPKGFAAKAVYTDLDAPGEKTVLRFAVVEPRVRYAGGNGVRYHQFVVRALPGGTKGFPLKAKAGEQAVTVNPAEIRTGITKFLDEIEAPKGDRPLALKNLKLIAFVQNDATNEVLTATAVDLGDK